MTVISELRKVTEYDDNVRTGLGISAGGGGLDQVVIADGVISYAGDSRLNSITGATINLVAPGSSGNVKANYIYVNKTTNALAVEQTAEGTTATEYDLTKYNMAAAERDGVDHYNKCYIARVIATDTPGTYTMYDMRPFVGVGT